ncbi:MAG TPA: methyltransferase domain-containing protein [Deltaproteobacteria bacterium]|nr:methyltransferase domain-containing protein [Deltaproteobacteria bacterium]
MACGRPGEPATPGVEVGPVEEIGPYRLVQEAGGQPVTTDSLLLARFVLPLAEGDRVLDIGTATAFIPLYLAWKSPAAHITAVEIRPGACALAEANVERNGLARRISVVNADFRELPERFAPGSFDVVVSNPPYVRKGEGRMSPDAERAAARMELHGGAAELFAVSRHLIGESGRMCCIYPLRRLEEVRAAAESAALAVRRLEVAEGTGRFLMEVTAGDGGL